MVSECCLLANGKTPEDQSPNRFRAGRILGRCLFSGIGEWDELRVGNYSSCTSVGSDGGDAGGGGVHG